MDDGIFGISGEIKHLGLRASRTRVVLTSSRPLMPGMTTSVITRSILPLMPGRCGQAASPFSASRLGSPWRAESRGPVGEPILRPPPARMVSEPPRPRPWRGHRRVFRRLFDPRQINPEGGAASRFALHHHVSATLLDDAVDRRESQAGAFAFFLGGEKRLEDSRLRFFVHAHAGVADRKHRRNRPGWMNCCPRR